MQVNDLVTPMKVASSKASDAIVKKISKGNIRVPLKVFENTPPVIDYNLYDDS